MNDQINKILSLVHTKSQVGEVLAALENFAGAFFTAKEQSEEMKQYFYHLPKDLADALSQLLANEPITGGNRDKVETLTKTLQNALRACPVLTLTIAFLPDEKTILTFSDWSKTNIGLNTVLDVLVDKQVGGGAIVVFKGKYKDYTIKKKLSSTFQIQREEIVSLLGNSK